MSKVVCVREVEPRTVYAVETSTGTFISDGLAHHNCPRCNGFLNGNYLFYARWMRKHHEEEEEQLMDLFDQHKKGTAPKLSVIEKQALYNSWLLKGRKLEEKTSLKLFPKSWDYVNIK